MDPKTAEGNEADVLPLVAAEYLYALFWQMTASRERGISHPLDIGFSRRAEATRRKRLKRSTAALLLRSRAGFLRACLGAWTSAASLQRRLKAFSAQRLLSHHLAGSFRCWRIAGEEQKLQREMAARAVSHWASECLKRVPHFLSR